MDARRLLDQFLGAGTTNDLLARGRSVLGQGTETGRGGLGLPSGSELSQGLNQLVGSVTGGRGVAGLGDALGGNLGLGVLGAGLGALLLRSRPGNALGSVVKVGGLALVGGLAYKAYRDWQAKQGVAGATPAPASAGELPAPPADSPFHPDAPRRSADARALDLLRAMIAAAKSDGHIDPEEQRRIFGKLDSYDLGAEEKAFVVDELRAPLDIEKVAAPATTREAAVEIYAASLIAVDPEGLEERAYLDRLATRLGLERSLVAELEATARAALSPSHSAV